MHLAFYALVKNTEKPVDQITHRQVYATPSGGYNFASILKDQLNKLKKRNEKISSCTIYSNSLRI
jgi:hypothetical protein